MFGYGLGGACPRSVVGADDLTDAFESFDLGFGDRGNPAALNEADDLL